MTMHATGTVEELLASDDGEQFADSLKAKSFQALCDGSASKKEMKALVSALLPVIAGPGRHMFAAKVSLLQHEDGVAIFESMHRTLGNEDIDADFGTAKLAKELDLGKVTPTAEAQDLVATVRHYGYRSAHEGVGVAWALERRWPVLADQLAKALVDHYGVSKGAVRFLTDLADQRLATESRIRSLVERYLVDPYDVYEARRAAREATWCLTALLESVEGK